MSIGNSYPESIVLFLTRAFQLKYYILIGKHRRKRVCKAGAGQEATKGKCDTPGFPLSDTFEVKWDRRRSKKLCVPRNHTRVNQTSLDLLQSWRANCDVQILVYNCDPRFPDPSEIARITDYVASYSCKGNITLKEEREQTKKLVLAAEDVTGDESDVKRVCKQVMNKCATKRLISKQEAMVLLADLDLTVSSEGFELVSTTISCRLRTSKSDVPKKPQKKKFINEYATRDPKYENLSLCQYFHATVNSKCSIEKRKNGKIIIPNFAGVNGNPKYPVTDDYARHTIIVHRPWREFPKNVYWKAEFENFINGQPCPTSARLAYERVMRRFHDNMTHYEAKASNPDHSHNPVDDDDNDLMALVGLDGKNCTNHENHLMDSMERGIDFEWNRKPMVRNKFPNEILHLEWIVVNLTWKICTLLPTNPRNEN